MGKHKQVECKICFKPMRSDVVKRHMKIHVKYNQPEKYGVKLQSNEEMCREPGLVDSVLEKTSEQTNINEELSEERHGSKRAFDDSSHNSPESYSINEGALRKALLKKSQEYKLALQTWEAALNLYINELETTLSCL